MKSSKPGINAGKLRHRIQLQQPSVTRDAFQGAVDSFTTVAEVSAQVEPLGGQELFNAQAVLAESTHRVTVRYRADVAADWRVLYGSRVLNIGSVNDVGERRRELELICAEVTR